MKAKGVLHAELSALIAAMGHGDLIVIGDAGLPVPPDVPCIDLAVSPGVPQMFQVLDAVLQDLVVERATIATEVGADLGAAFLSRLPKAEAVPHEEFKRLSRDARAVVRSGEFTPYANVALWAGVPF